MDKDLFLLCRFHTSNHRLPIEIGRCQNINRENRVCNLCQGRELGDEYHYFIEFTEFKHDRARLITEKYRCRPNAVKYFALMCLNSVVKLSKFNRIVNSKVGPWLAIDLCTSFRKLNMFVHVYILIIISLPCNLIVIIKIYIEKLKACCHYQNFLWPSFLGQSFWRIFDSDNGQRKLWSKTLKDFDGIESHPIFLETWMDFDGN